MQSLADFLMPVSVMAAPLLLLMAGLVPAGWANAHAGFMVRLNLLMARLALVCALLAASLFPFASVSSWVVYSQTLPGGVGAFSIGTLINSVTIIMLLLVSFVGVIVSGYARNYLQGETDRGRFHKYLSLTLASILTLIVSGNLLLFSMAWIATSLFLHQLLMFYKQRPAAALAAHKKFVASRISDVCLLLAIYLIGSTLHTLEFETLFAVMSEWSGPLPAALHWAAGLIVISAALKSAQFPFHGWLIQVMEAPTPVSALLHAGIVNAGAFLVIRMSPVMADSPTAMLMLALIGLVTLALASLVMLTQTSIKVSLAWSTSAQMGFMLLECGLGLYSLAMLHLVAHSLYKAHAFLASGSGVDAYRAPEIHFSPAGLSGWRQATALSITVLTTLVIGGLFGITLDSQPALLAAGAIVAVALSQLMLQALNIQSESSFLLRAAALSLLVCLSYFSLHHGFELMIAGSVLPLDETQGGFHNIMAMLVIGVFAGLLLMQRTLKSDHSALREKMYMHLYNGFYIDVYLTRVLQRIWPVPTSTIKYYGD
ncbi:MAG TPA: NADH-quinone oxidoreductase subunit L [Gammaproteobacteria bacterium]